MTKITVSLPENIHQQILKLAQDENDSISYTVTRLVEIGLLVLQNKKEKNNSNELEEHCQKLIIQVNEIIKELVIDKFNFNQEKIAAITRETLVKFNALKAVS